MCDEAGASLRHAVEKWDLWIKCAPMVTSVWPLPRPGRVDKKGFWPTWLDLRLPFGVPPSVFCTHQLSISPTANWSAEEGTTAPRYTYQLLYDIRLRRTAVDQHVSGQ